MIDEKIIIKKIENRIDAFVKEYPEKKDGLEVQTLNEFIHMLQIEAKEQAKRSGCYCRFAKVDIS